MSTLRKIEKVDPRLSLSPFLFLDLKDLSWFKCENNYGEAMFFCREGQTHLTLYIYTKVELQKL